MSTAYHARWSEGGHTLETDCCGHCSEYLHRRGKCGGANNDCEWCLINQEERTP